MYGSHNLQSRPWTLHQLVSPQILKGFPAGTIFNPPFFSFPSPLRCFILHVSHCQMFLNCFWQKCFTSREDAPGFFPENRRLCVWGGWRQLCKPCSFAFKKRVFSSKQWNPLFTGCIVNICGREVFLLYACNDKGKPSTGRRKDQPT